MEGTEIYGIGQFALDITLVYLVIMINEIIPMKLWTFLFCTTKPWLKLTKLTMWERVYYKLWITVSIKFNWPFPIWFLNLDVNRANIFIVFNKIIAAELNAIIT